jgi:cytochrome c-type biogenesis protein CcmH/NrfF
VLPQRLRRAFAAVLMGTAMGSIGLAAPAVDSAADPALEARVQRVAAELRCLVCQNQSLADSHADLALDLKNQVREQLRAGRTPDEVVTYMTDRYGDFVLYRPPFKTTTLLLWLGPALLLLVLVAALWRGLARQGRSAGGAPMDDEAAARAAALLGPDRESVN